MIRRGTKYRIVGVHKEDAHYPYRETFKDVLVEAIGLSRRENWLKKCWHGEIKFLEDDKEAYWKSGEVTYFYAVYLRRVKEEAK